MSAHEGEVWHGVQPPPADPPAPIGERVRRRSLLDPADSRWDRQVTLDNAKPEPYTYTHFNRDDLRGQLRSLRVLEQLLEQARREDLPAMTWTVTAHSVSGQISPIGGPSPDGCRAAFMAWVDALGAKWREHRHGGQVELRGAAKLPGVGGEAHLEVGVGLVATWWDIDEVPPVMTENA